MTRPIDHTSIEGKQFPTEDRFQLVVLGAGAAGLAAAIEAARLGLRVLLVDEHPVSSSLIGLDVPWMFGERMTAAVQNKPRMLERVVAARPDLEQAFEAGVEVRLGVYVWGAFVEGATSHALPGRVLALADEERSWLVGFDRLIVAAGARDLALAFPGWDRPGVMGAQGFAAAIGLYDAFAGRRVVVLGAGAAGLLLACGWQVGRASTSRPWWMLPPVILPGSTCHFTPVAKSYRSPVPKCRGLPSCPAISRPRSLVTRSSAPWTWCRTWKCSICWGAG